MRWNRSEIVSEESSSQKAMDGGKQSTWGGSILGWWYRSFAPPEPPGTASVARRERAQRGKLASIAVLILILFVLSMLPQAVTNRSPMQVMAIGVGIAISFLALFLNRRGLIELAGVLTLVLLYSGQAFSLFTHAGGLTQSSFTSLDFSVIPDVLVLAFFSASSLLPIVCINILVTWALVVYGPHDAAIAHLLHNAPLQIFVPAYTLQLITAAAMYLWARSTELALKRADRAEEIAAFEKRENERRQRALEQKRELNAGVQQLLQTLVAAANGDLSARAPLSQDHILWQVAMSLNNLIARLQSMSHMENELRQQIEGNERVTSPQRALRSDPGGTTGAQKALRSDPGRATGAQRALLPEAGGTTRAQRAQRAQRSRSGVTDQIAKIKQEELPRAESSSAGSHARSGVTDQIAKIKQDEPPPRSGITDQIAKIRQDELPRPESGSAGGHLKALHLLQDDSPDHEKVAPPQPDRRTEVPKAVHQGEGETRDDGA
jgi:hypothetical protein